MAVDFDAIATAIAARFAPAQVTQPAGETNIRSSSAAPPDQLGGLPAVLVFPDAGEFATGNGTRAGRFDFLVRFYLSQTVDLARESARITKWLTVLTAQMRTGVQLGGAADVARVESYKVGQMDYAGITYSGIELRVHVVASEAWAATA